MDNKAVFVRTSKGEDEISGKTAKLYSAIKRVLLMVDGDSTCGEISKRVAPSLRGSLDEMFGELEKGGFIRDKAKAGNILRMSVPPKMSAPQKTFVPPGMSVPPKMIVPHKAPPETDKPVEETGGDLDFMGEFFALTPAQIMAEAAKTGKHMEEKGSTPKQDANGGKLKAQQEAEEILRKAEQEAARIREEAAREEKSRRAREEAEAIRKKAAQEAEQLQIELEANRLRAEKEALARVEAAARERLEAAAKAQQQAEADRMKAAKEAVLARDAAERIAKLEREAAKVRLEEEARAQQRAEAERIKAAQEAALAQEAAERIARIEQEAAAARAEAERLARQRADEQSPKKAAGYVPEANPEPEIKLDPFFVFDQFNLTAPSAAPPKKTASVVEDAPEIKLDSSIFEAPRTAIPLSPAGKHKGNAGQTDQPDKEQIKREEEQRIAEEAEARKRAEAESLARARAEAQQREAEAAKMRAELTFQNTLPPTSRFNYEAQKGLVSRTRKPFPWGKLAIFLLVLLTGALFILPYVLPMRDYMHGIEQMLSAKFRQPVHIGQLSGRILPTPRLEVGEIYAGEAKQFQAKQAQLNFSILGLFGDSKPIDSIELLDVKVTGAGLTSATAWLQQLAADSQYPVRRIVISQGALDADAIQFTGIDGQLIFNQAGKFTHADLRANGGKMTLSIDAPQQGNPQVSISMYTSALPLLPGWAFDELTAKGELISNGLRISEFDGRISGGILQGDANIDWRSGWRAQGTLVAKSISMEKLSKGLSGDLDGSGRFNMQGTNLQSIADAATMDGTFIVRKGVVTGIDIVETARSRSKESMPGGRTHFDELSGILTAVKDNYSIRQLKLNAGELIVTGKLDIGKQQLSGEISADLTKWSDMGKVTMQVTGTTDNPSLRAAQ
ncbi:MAG: hypothetical protein NUV63_02025 [Gallionella sp.]|nr:hypothetical protein [Gallionella sp.]